MKNVFTFLGAILFFSTQSVYAESLTNQSLPPCLEIDMSSDAPIGTSCITSAGIEFTRYKDPETGVTGIADLGEKGAIWLDGSINSRFRKIAVQVCKDAGGVLPHREIFERAERHAFREAIQEMSDGTYWSSSLWPAGRTRPTKDPIGWVFSGNSGNGYTVVISRWRAYSHISTKCILRAVY